MGTSLTQPDYNMLLLDFLQRPWDWKIASSLLPPELEEITRPRREKWRHLAGIHRHPWRQITVLLIGDECLAFNDRPLRSVPGTVAFFDDHQPHGDHPLSSTLPETLVFRVNLKDGRVLTRFYHHKLGGELTVPTPEDMLLPPGIGDSLEACWDDLKRDRNGNPALRRSKLIHATGSFLSEVLDSQLCLQIGRGHPQEELLDAIAQHLRHTAGSGATVASLAAMAGYSKDHFARVFRSHTGKTVHQYVTECRVAEIRRQAGSGLSQTVIAAELGFSDLSAYLHWRARHFPDGLPDT